MIDFLLKRTLWMLLVLFVVSLITFVLMHQVPGGPFDREKALPERIIENLNAKYNLDEPLWKQYAFYIYDVLVPRITSGEIEQSTTNSYLINVKFPFGDEVHFRWMNFGPSYASRSRTVNDIFRENLPISMQLGVASFFIAIIIGVPLGAIAALNCNSMLDYSSMGAAVFGVSVPVIILGPTLRYIFGVQLQWLPPTGWGDFTFMVLPNDWEAVKFMILPSVALGTSSAALLARLTRASLLQVMDEDYIRTARAKGLSEFTVLNGHAMKNALIPVVTVLGPLFAALITGTFVTEVVFGISGMGRYFITSITNRDYPVIMGTILLYAFFLVFANFFVDVVYAWLDPRIRYD